MAVRDLSACDPREGAELLGSLLGRTWLLRDTPPYAAICAFLQALNAGDALLCLRRYHDLTAALLATPARRVSGDLWKDYLLHTLLLTEHPFAAQSARGGADEAIALAMQEELAVLCALCAVTDTELARLTTARMQALRLKSRQARDNIELFSTAVWSGGTPRALPTPEEQQTPAAYSGELHFAAWRYGEAGLRESYVSDEALEELYARLLKSNRWTEQLEDLRCFFAAYGCGPLLKDRAFAWQDGALVPLCARAIAPLPEPVCFPDAHERLLDVVIRFMQGDAPTHVLLRGDAGMGKTAQAFSLLYELPEVRLIRLAPDALDAVCAQIEGLPLKFLLLMENLTEAPDCPGLLPENAMLLMTSRAALACDYAECLQLGPLSPGAFTEFVCALTRGTQLDYADVHSACVDHQAESGRLSAAAAVRIARALRESC